MGFAKFHACFPELRGARGDEQVLVVFLELGALVGGNGIFQCQRMQAERLAQTGDERAVGRLQLDPYETISMTDMVTDAVEGDGLGGGVLEEQAVDDGLRSEA
jgi:hypothetical protein